MTQLIDTHGLESPIKLVVLISGGGRTLQNLIDCIERGTLHAQIAAVISTRRKVEGVERAQRHQLPCHIVSPKKFESNNAFSDAITKILDEVRPDLVCAAGFMSFYEIPNQYMGKVINIHPALLPKFGGKGFYGQRVHQAVLEAGESVSGCTVHFMNNVYDGGRIIFQKSVPVQPDETAESLAAKVFDLECEAYPEAIRKIAQGDIK